MPRYVRRQVERRKDPEMAARVSVFNMGHAGSPPLANSSQRTSLLNRRQTPSVLSFLVLSLLALSGCGGVKANAPSTKPPEVEVAYVLQKDVPIVSEWTATLDGYVNAQIQPR